MMNLIMVTLYTLNSLIFAQMTHPLAMTLTIILQTCIVCATMGMMSTSFWFSYILFLIFLGGMLVLFIYITSLASNELFHTSSKILTLVLFLLSTTIVISLLSDNYLWDNFTKAMDLLPIDLSTSMLNPEATPHLMKLYNSPNHLITLMLVIYLFLTLIVVVKITNIFQGPLRQKL